MTIDLKYLKLYKEYLYTQKTFHQESRYMIRTYSFYFKTCVVCY